MLVLVRIAPEINLKSRQVKARFLKTLVSNMRLALKKTGNPFKISEKWTRIYVELEESKDLAVLTRVFGISSLSPVEMITKPALDDIISEAQSKYTSLLPGKTFAIRAKRRGAVGFTSKDIEVALGSALLNCSKGVDLSKPDIKIEVEVCQQRALFFQERIPCPGGLPLGTEGRALCMLSGGFDSAVAAWLSMKRGVAVDFVLCNLGGNAYARSVIMVAKKLSENWAYGYEPRFYILDFAEIRDDILKNARSQYSQILLKRAMYQSCHLLFSEQKKWLALITGESLGRGGCTSRRRSRRFL